MLYSIILFLVFYYIPFLITKGICDYTGKSYSINRQWGFVLGIGIIVLILTVYLFPNQVIVGILTALSSLGIYNGFKNFC